MLNHSRPFFGHFIIFLCMSCFDSAITEFQLAQLDQSAQASIRSQLWLFHWICSFMYCLLPSGYTTRGCEVASWESMKDLLTRLLLPRAHIIVHQGTGLGVTISHCMYVCWTLKCTDHLRCTDLLYPHLKLKLCCMLLISVPSLLYGLVLTAVLVSENIHIFNTVSIQISFLPEQFLHLPTHSSQWFSWKYYNNSHWL